MRINEKKSCCLRNGPRFKVTCAQITTADGYSLPWVDQIRYLPYYWTTSEVFSLRGQTLFFRSTNVIFGKIRRLASEEVTHQLVQFKCMPIVLYGLECFSVAKADN